MPSKSAAGRYSDASTISSDSLNQNSSNNASQALKDEKSSENRSLKRKARELSPPSEKAEPCMFAELPGDIISLILLYIVHKDRLSVATTGQDSLKRVESFSEQKWHELLPKADTTWEARIRDESQIETENPMPLVLPHRYLLWKAHRTHMYSLDAPGEDDQAEKMLSLDILPDGSLMACQSSEGSFDVSQIWNLSKRQLLASAQLEKGDEEVTFHVQVCEEFIIVEYYRCFRVFTLDGKLLHHVATSGESHVIQTTAAGQKGVYFVTSHEGGVFGDISRLDLAEGTVTHYSVTNQGRSMNYSLIVLGNALIFRCCNVPESRNDPIANGIYVYDIDEAYSPQQKQYLCGEYDSLTQASDAPSIIVAAGRSHIDVFKLENGKLICTTTLAIPLNLMSLAVLHVTKSQLVLGSNYTNDDLDTSIERDIRVYSLLNGELLRALGLQGRSVGRVVTTNGCTLFIGYNSIGSNRDDTSVKAYCLDGY